MYLELTLLNSYSKLANIVCFRLLPHYYSPAVHVCKALKTRPDAKSGSKLFATQSIFIPNLEQIDKTLM